MALEERKQRITGMVLDGNIKNMEEYKHLVGALESLDYIGRELRDILEKEV